MTLNFYSAVSDCWADENFENLLKFMKFTSRLANNSNARDYVISIEWEYIRRKENVVSPLRRCREEMTTALRMCFDTFISLTLDEVNKLLTLHAFLCKSSRQLMVAGVVILSFDIYFIYQTSDWFGCIIFVCLQSRFQLRRKSEPSKKRRRSLYLVSATQMMMIFTVAVKIYYMPFK